LLRHSGRGRPARALALGVAILVLSACGGSGDQASSPPTEDVAATGEEFEPQPEPETRTATEEPSDPAMAAWVAGTEELLEVAAEMRAEMDAIREEFAVCDFSHLAEFNSLYYADRRQLIDLIKQNAPPAEAVLMQQDLLEALQREIDADSVRSTSATLDLAEARTSGCAGGDSNESDDEADEAKRSFIDAYNQIAPELGGTTWSVDDF
jgi:hypothetical protein